MYIDKVGSVDSAPPLSNNFFKSSTSQINYKFILGFERKPVDEEDEEAAVAALHVNP